MFLINLDDGSNIIVWDHWHNKGTLPHQQPVLLASINSLRPGNIYMHLGSDNGLSPVRHKDIIWTTAWILLIWPWSTNFTEIFIKIEQFSFKKMLFKMSWKRRPFCFGLNVLTEIWTWTSNHFFIFCVLIHLCHSRWPRDWYGIMQYIVKQLTK